MPPVPHWHAPAAEQLSARVGSHAKQTAPAVPQAESERGVQTVPLQQLLGQDVASHTQTPPEQR